MIACYKNCYKPDGTFKKTFFLNFCLCGVFTTAHRLSLVLAGRGFSLWWFLLLQSMGSRTVRASSVATLGLQTVGSVAVAPCHVESSWIRDQTCVLCFGRWILYYWTTREVPEGT